MSESEVSKVGGSPVRGTAPVGIIDLHPIQYRAPLYQLLAKRGVVEFEVLFLKRQGTTGQVDPGFGVAVAWDIDLESGYSFSYLDEERPKGYGCGHIRALRRWVIGHDVIVVHGYSEPLMLVAVMAALESRIPYLIRGDSLPNGHSRGIRRVIREMTAHSVVAGSFGGISIGTLNSEFYRKHRARHIFLAPYSVDNEYFGAQPRCGRSELLASHGLDDRLPVVMYCGKIYSGKRPMDLVHAVNELSDPVNLIFVGDGKMAQIVRESLPVGRGVVTGFVNQLDIPSYYQAADVLVMPSGVENWGLAINEAMAAGVVPVSSDRVGAAPDLVEGVGVVYQCGDVRGLTRGLTQALTLSGRDDTRERIKRRVSQYSLERSAIGFETALVSAQRQSRS